MGDRHGCIEAFFQSDRVIGVSYQPGFRGGLVERMISLSPEISKPRDAGTSDRGDIAGWMTALGFAAPSDIATGWYFWEAEQRMEREDPEWSFLDVRGRIMDEISGLYWFDGQPIHGSVRDGCISFLSHWDVNRLRQIWPNARYVIPHWPRGYRWFRDVYSKVHAKELHKAEMDDMRALAEMHGLDTSGIRTIIQYHAWKWSGFARYDEAVVRDFMRREIGRISAKQKLNRMHKGVHTLDMSMLFSRDHWMACYRGLCGFCGITPNYELCAALLEDYNAKQWMR